MFFEPVVHNGANDARANTMPWYEVERRFTGERFAPHWGPPRLYAGNIPEANAFIAEAQERKRHIMAISAAVLNEQGHLVTIIYQERMPNGHDEPTES